MSDVFEGYERQYCELSANLSKKCTSASLLDGAGTASSYDDNQLAAESAKFKQLLLDEFEDPSDSLSVDDVWEYLKEWETEKYTVEMDVELSKKEGGRNMAFRLLEEVCGSGGRKNIGYQFGSHFTCKLREAELKIMKSKNEVLSVELFRPDCCVVDLDGGDDLY